MNIVRDIDGVQTFMHLQDGNLISGTQQDCTPILEDAQARHNEGMHGTSELKHAARLPAVVVETYMNVHGLTFHEVMSDPCHFRAMCNAPDLKGFRIWPGRV